MRSLRLLILLGGQCLTCPGVAGIITRRIILQIFYGIRAFSPLARLALQFLFILPFHGVYLKMIAIGLSVPAYNAQHFQRDTQFTNQVTGKASYEKGGLKRYQT